MQASDSNREMGRPGRTVVALAGGVGGAKLAHGLQMALPPGALSVVVNTGDDFRLWGLRMSPDLDTVMYTLGGVANRETGWGVAGETWSTLEMLGRYGVDTWFRVGDKDFATHLARTGMLSSGSTLSQVTSRLSEGLGIPSSILPMCDEPVETLIQTEQGTLDFQDYFVRRHHADRVTGVLFRGIESARPTTDVLSAIGQASVIVFCPSNPFVSIGPVLAVPGMRAALLGAGAPRVAVSPIVGGAAIKGPAAGMLKALGHEVSAAGVAALYRGVIDGMVIDTADKQLVGRIEALGMAVHTANTVMQSDSDREQLAHEVLAFGERLATMPERTQA